MFRVSAFQKVSGVFTAATRHYATAAAVADSQIRGFDSGALLNSAQSKKRTVPTIDISSYMQNPHSMEAESILARVREACLGTGFFQIVGHGVPQGLQQATFDAATKFFALPFGEKSKLDARVSLGHRGYDVLASQAYEHDLLPDLKEGFYVGEDLPLDDPRVKSKRFFMGQNIWPPAEKLPYQQFRTPVEAYFRAMRDLGDAVMRMVARTLPYGEDVFNAFLSNNPVTPLRLLHYPPRQDTERPQFGSSAHTDFGAITLLLQDQNPGLQVLENDEWIPVPPDPNAYVVNIGDMLSKWTGGAYKSSVHRVLNENASDRYSIVFFLDGNLDCKLAPLDGSTQEGKVVTVEEHMIHRMAESYGKGKQ